MRISIHAPNVRDELHLVCVSKFMEIIDICDLEKRSSKEVVDAYHVHWLTQVEGGGYKFHAPVFYLNDGHARFINGRHRFVLLARHMHQFPMALAEPAPFPGLSAASARERDSLVKRISLGRVCRTDFFEFPNLPIEYLGFDPNIGK